MNVEQNVEVYMYVFDILQDCLQQTLKSRLILNKMLILCTFLQVSILPAETFKFLGQGFQRSVIHTPIHTVFISQTESL